MPPHFNKRKRPPPDDDASNISIFDLIQQCQRETAVQVANTAVATSEAEDAKRRANGECPCCKVALLTPSTRGCKCQDCPQCVSELRKRTNRRGELEKEIARAKDRVQTIPVAIENSKMMRRQILDRQKKKKKRMWGKGGNPHPDNTTEDEIAFNENTRYIEEKGPMALKDAHRDLQELRQELDKHMKKTPSLWDCPHGDCTMCRDADVREIAAPNKKKKV